jgi:hypothetical protein
MRLVLVLVLVPVLVLVLVLRVVVRHHWKGPVGWLDSTPKQRGRAKRPKRLTIQGHHTMVPYQY